MASVSSFKVEYNVSNKSNKNMIVKVKGGMSYILRRSKEPTYDYDRRLLVKVNDVYLEDVDFDIEDAVTALDKQIMEELNKHKKMIKDREHYYPDLTYCLTADIKLNGALSEQDISADAIHSEFLGLTLYLGEHNLNSPALFTPTHSINTIFQEWNKESEGGIRYTIYINDPGRISKPYFTNIMGKAYEIPVINDQTQKPGLYIGFEKGNSRLEEPYYTFESLGDKKFLESLGVFESKAACEMNANTERFSVAESKCKDLAKDNQKLHERLNTSEDLLSKSKNDCERLASVLEQTKRDFNETINRMKTEHHFELSQVKVTSKMMTDLMKHESRVKEIATKTAVEQLKYKSENNYWADLAKAIGTLAGLGFTGYKLLTS